jgi:hypothetical protein
VTTNPAAAVASTDRWERSVEVLWRRTASGVVVLPNDGSTAFTLEGLHAQLWDALGRPMSHDGLVAQLGEHLPTDRAEGDRTVADAVRFLVSMGAVRESQTP